jgi:hypothetical protein
MSDAPPGCQLPWYCRRPAVEGMLGRLSAGTAADDPEALAGLDGCAACQHWYDAHDVPAVVPPPPPTSTPPPGGLEAQAERQWLPRSGRTPQRPPPEAAQRGARFQIDRYHMYDAPASGSMGSTYRAWDPRLLRQVALKVLDGVTTDKPDLALREAQASAGIDHPNLVPIYDAGTDQTTGLGFIVSAWVRGQTLAERLNPNGRTVGRPLPWPKAVAIARQVLSALAALHVRGVVHRDLKPANLMLEDDDLVRVLDLGIARTGLATEGPHGRSGTVAYMSPEQFANRDERDPRSDLYAVGLILRQMLTGSPPRRPPPSAEAVGTPADDPPEFDAPPAVLANLRAVLARSLARAPADRFQSADDMAAALDVAVNAPQLAAPIDLATARSRQESFFNDAERLVSARPDWFDAVAGRAFRRAGNLEVRRGEDGIDAGVRHAATALLAWRSWGVRPPRRLWVLPAAPAVRVVAVTAARIDRFMAGRPDEGAADRDLLVRAINRAANHAGCASAIILVDSPTGWEADVLVDLSVHRPGLCVLLYDPSRTNGPWVPAGGEAAVGWAEHALVGTPALTLADVAARFTPARAELVFGLLAAAGPFRVEVWQGTGKVLRQRDRASPAEAAV